MEDAGVDEVQNGGGVRVTQQRWLLEVISQGRTREVTSGHSWCCQNEERRGGRTVEGEVQRGQVKGEVQRR